MLERFRERLSWRERASRLLERVRGRVPLPNNPPGKVFDWLTARLGRPPVKELPLTFALDRTGDGQHAVWVYREMDDGPEPVADIRPLLQVGYREGRDLGEEEAIYVLGEEDRQTLLAIKSMDPQIGEDGGLLFDFAPPILNYVRRKENVAESKGSRRLQISSERLRPRARVDFDPLSGVSVQTGYEVEAGEPLIAHAQLPRTADGGYTLVDDTFHPVDDEPPDSSAGWLQNPSQHRSLNEVPHFYREEVPQLEEDFIVDFSERAGRVEVDSRPLTPAIEIDYQAGSGLNVKAGYRVDDVEQLVNDGVLPKTPDGKYAILGDRFIPLPEKLSALGQELLRSGERHIPIQDVPEFFQRDLVLLKKEFNAVLTDLAREVNVVGDPFAPIVRVDRHDRGWLDFDVGYEAGGLTLPHERLSGQQGDYVQIDETTWVEVDQKAVEQTRRRVRELGAEITDDGFRIPISQFASLEEFIEAIGGRSRLSAAYREFLDQLTGFTADDGYRLSPSAEAQLREQDISLRPYQRAGIHWMSWLYRNHLHGVLADDMGLGKTIQSILAMREAYERTHTDQHSLVLCPKSVMPHWEREFHRFFPDIRTYRYHGASRRRALLGSVQPIVFVSTYATARSDVDHLVKVPFFYVVLDEASYIKNPSSKRTRAAKALNAQHRIALTGTPVENRPGELWSLFDFLMRGHLGHQARFERVFENPIISGDQGAAQRLAERIRPFLLRRKKEDVARDLPEKIELDEWCELSVEQGRLYGAVQEDARRLRFALQRGEEVSYATSILPVLQKLKQICDHPALVTEKTEPVLGRSEKFDWIVDKVSEIIRDGEQVAIFSHYLKMLDLLQAVIEERRIPYMRIDGSTDHRQMRIDRFNDGHATVALLSLRAAGHGITLTGANHVIHADRWWNPAVEDQATDRVHRIGQDKTVYVYRILVANTLEERIDELLVEKRGLADQIVGAATEGARRWSREELIELLRPVK